MPGQAQADEEKQDVSGGHGGPTDAMQLALAEADRGGQGHDQGRRLVTEYRRDTNGAAVINAFPRRQATALDPFADRKRGAAQPATPVPVNPPSVVVPRLTPTTTVTTALTPTTTVPPTTAVP